MITSHLKGVTVPLGEKILLIQILKKLAKSLILDKKI